MNKKKQKKPLRIYLGITWADIPKGEISAIARRLDLEAIEPIN